MKNGKIFSLLMEQKDSTLEDTKYVGITSLITNKSLYRSVTSDYTGFTWHFFMTNEEYRTALNQLFLTFIILTILIIVLGNLFIIYNARSQYKPIKQLLGRLVLLSGESFDEEENEYEIINKALVRLQSQKSNAEGSLTEYRAFMRETAIKDLLLGLAGDYSSLLSYSDKYGLNLHSEQCQVVLFSVDENSMADIDTDEENTDSAFSFILSCITEVLGSFSFDGNTTLVCEIQGYIACIINYALQDSSKDRERQLGKEYSQKALEEIQKRFGIDVYVGISNINYSLTGLKRSYDKAVEIIEYATLTGEKNKVLDKEILPFDSIRAKDSFRTMANNQTMLINCLRSGNYENARELFSERVVLPLREPPTAKKNSKLRLELVRDMLLEAFYEIRAFLPEKEWQRLQVDKRIYDAADIDVLAANVNLIFDELVSNTGSSEINNIREKDSELLTYVNTHFTDPNINIMQLAEMFEMSTSYLSKTFKRIAGVGLLDYIHSLRIQRAKALLETTDKTIKTISEETGYSNSLTMIRAFKRYEGITPSEYKKMICCPQ